MPVGRNDPCPCGSGRKYKKCCGAVTVGRTPLAGVRPRVDVIPIATASRQCGECTACCDGWVVGTIEGHEMKPGTPCFFRGEHTCTIYERRPQHPCRNFVCGWLQANSPFPESFRPDKLGVMVIPMKWRGNQAYVLRSAGRDPDPELLSWMRELSLRTLSPFFYEVNGERFGFGPPEFQQEMMARVERGESLW